MWIFVNALIENPTFDSQTKENMTLQAKSFGSTCQLSEKFIKAVSTYMKIKLEMSYFISLTLSSAETKIACCTILLQTPSVCVLLLQQSSFVA